MDCLPDLLVTEDTFLSIMQETRCKIYKNGQGRIIIEGGIKDCQSCRLLILQKLDSMFGLESKFINIDYELGFLASGRCRQNLNTLQSINDTSVYFPTPYYIENSNKNYYNNILVVGNNINELESSWRQGIDKIENKIIVRKVVISPRKLEWLYHSKKQEIIKISIDNNVVITFPTLMNTTNTITCTGLQQNLIDRAVRMLKMLICEYYVMSIQTTNVFDTMEAFKQFCLELHPLIFKVLNSFKVEVLIHKNIIEICGNSLDCQKAYLMITESSLVKIRDTKVQVELALEHKDFINGKKNGKINRIVKLSGCRVSFQENVNDVNMMIDLYSPQPSCLLQGLLMLEEELPAEMSFYVPEVYHKRIIGVAGKNIQKIMKRFGVYVKFSNLQEFQQMGGYYENIDNVICRTPAKNRDNMKDLKATILEVVNIPELIEISTIVKVPRQLINIMFRDGYLIKELEARYKTLINFPPCEKATDEIELFGPEIHASSASEFILVIIAFNHRKIYQLSRLCAELVYHQQFQSL